MANASLDMCGNTLVHRNNNEPHEKTHLYTMYKKPTA